MVQTAVAERAVSTRPGRSASSRREARNFWIYISPWLVGFSVFILGPMIYSLYLSFTNSKLGQLGNFIGTANYTEVFKDQLFYVAVRNTAYYALVSVPLQLVLAFFLASLLNKRIPAIGVFRTLFYLPSVIAGISTVLLWSWIFNSNYGLVNYLLSLFGITGPNWLSDERYAIPAIIIMSLHGVGAAMLIFLAALQGVPVSLYESAQLDGAGALQRILRITLPMISPTIFFNLILGIIGSLQVFTQPYIFSQLNQNLGRNRGMYVYVQYLFDTGFRYYRAGYGSAIAWLLFAFTLIISLIIMRTSRNWVYYSDGGE
ncbi:MAG: carbohydrate ABC transporter permease [Propionibacteriaceae bacterium]